MLKASLASYLTRFVAITAVIVLLSAMGMFALSNYLSNSVFSVSNRSELEKAIAQADQQLERYNAGEIKRSELREIVNPAINSGDIFMMLLTPDTRVAAYTESAVAYFSSAKLVYYCQQLDKGKTLYSSEWETGGLALLMGQKTENGYVFAGKPMRAFMNASSSFRVSLITWFLPMLLLICLFGGFMMRIFARPVNVLTDAAAKVASGETVDLDEELPGEIGEVARAFNQMSERIAHTISELNQEKETMRMILESLSEGILALDADGTTILENSAALELMGAAGTTAHDKVMNALQECLKSGQNGEGRVERGDAVLQYFITHLPSDQKRRGVIALVRDVTEQERLEQTRHDYVANISHELRTPLANMRGLAEGLRDGLVTDADDQMRYYGIIVEEVKRLSRLVNDLLELSGLQSNPKAFEMEKVEPTEIMWELYDLNKKPFSDKNQTLLLEVPQDDLPTIITNEDRLSEVLTIFLDNARKYTNEGGTIVLGAQPDMQDGLLTGVRFYVRDNGIGMDEETQKHVFERFHQADKSHSQKGSGLGLSIAREILLKLGVSITLKSELGKGSEFSFILPVP